MAEENRFINIFDDTEAEAEAETEAPKPAPKPTAKRQAKREPKAPKASAKNQPKYKDPNYVQVGLYLPRDLHQKLKIGSAITQKELSDIAAEALAQWAKKNVPNI